MDKKNDMELHNKVKKMMVEGESWDKIMEETHLRLKDLRRIQREEITPKF
jgi:hypothetical protein